MNPKSKWQEITLFLAIAAGIFCACYCVLAMANNYYVARYNLDIYTQDLQGWDACRQTEPGYYKANAEVVSSCLKNLDSARENFWLNLSTGQLAGLFVLAGSGGAVGGYLSTWAVVWFGSSVIGKFGRWFRLCISANNSRQSESCQYPCQAEQQDAVKLVN